MRQYMCCCSECSNEIQIRFDEPYPQYGDSFLHYCDYCNNETYHSLVLTRKIASELRQKERENALKEAIIKICEKYGFTCRFLYESVIIKTQISSWQFSYKSEKKTLRHESTVKINFETGNYAKTHEQFKDRQMTSEEVIDYIAAHDEWRSKNG